MRRLVTEIGEAGIMLGNVWRHIFAGHIDWGESVRLIDRFGISSIPIVGLSASFIGMAISVQIAREIVVRYGADNVVGGFIALTILRELAPVFVAIVIAGNVGAAITAELGTMQVTDQIDALRVFRINPVVYLVVPRIIATAISGPALTGIGAVLALVAGQLFTEALVHIPAEIFWDSVRYAATTRDVVNMLTKSLVFAIAIALLASYNGLATEGSSESVGINTTRTVVWCLLATFMLNYLLTSIFFQL
ncbi:MAG TPA: ABC transporter permease [Coleofasciculaceae cyanobacterium]|jgi:phospholipid/cholesterol/gamma-HCH transport system permease protein